MLSSIPGAVKLLVEGSNRSLWTFVGGGRCTQGEEEEEEGRIAGASAENATHSAEAVATLVNDNSGTIDTSNSASAVPALKGILKPYVPPAPLDAADLEAEEDEQAGDAALGAAEAEAAAAAVAHNGSTGSKPKRSRKRRGKNRARSDSQGALVERDLAGTAAERRGLQWGFVEEVLFSRGLSMDTVPSDGSYPLGLGAEVGRCRGTVDEAEEQRSVALLDRAVALGVVHRSQVAVSAEGEARSMHLVEAEAPALALETRQFDYKRGKNPLFGRLTEHDRITELGRPRSSSTDLASSFVSSSSDAVSVSGAGLSELGKELNKIRLNRLEVGCMCRPIKLDKLSVTKMKAELTGSFGLPAVEVEAMSKAELTAKLREVIQGCQLCVTNNCACVQQDIPCSADTCNCLKGRVRTEAQQPCSNRNGQWVFDPEAVNRYRCQFISIDNLIIRQREKRSGSI